MIENGILKYRHSESNILQSHDELNLDKKYIGEIELRIKLKESTKLRFGWSHKYEAKAFNYFETDYLTMWTTPDNQFHTYKIDAQPFLKAFGVTGLPIKKFFLYPFETTHDSIEIDYLKLTPRYLENSVGTQYETINKEMRRVLYMNSSFGLTYEVHIPDEKPMLKFGTGIFETGDPVRFSVIIDDNTGEDIVYSKQISEVSMWHDACVDLSEYAGKKVNISFVTEGSGKNIAFWSNPVLYTPPKKRFNIILVLEDALRSDRLSLYDYARKTSPLKDALAEKGVIFLNAVSQSTRTRSSCPSFMTSLYPTSTGVWNDWEALDDSYLTFAEIMRSQGFATASFVQNVNAGPHAGLHQGFGTLVDRETLGSRAHGIYNGDRLKQWIENNNDRNFFLYLHIMDPHGPYDPPEEVISKYKKPYLGGKIRVKKNTFLIDPEWLEIPTVESRNFLYDEEIRYNDSQFEHLLDLLQDNGMLDHTLIIFISDHGEFLGENGLWQHMPPGYIQVLHVPLIMVYGQQLPPNKKIHQYVQLIDIMPTVLEFSKINTEQLLIQGNSLIPLIEGKNDDHWDNRICLSEEVYKKKRDDKISFGSIFYKNYHILNSDELTDSFYQSLKTKPGGNFFSVRVFNLSEDRNEIDLPVNFLTDIFLNYTTKRIMSELVRWNYKTWRAVTKDSEQVVMFDPETIKTLKELGYLQ